MAVSVHSLQADTRQTVSLFSTFFNSHRVNTLHDSTGNCFSTLALSSEVSNETFTYNQALQQPDYHDFIEVDDHETYKHWTLMLHCDMPSDTKTIMSIWSFKQKRYPNGTLNKHKARLCTHGGMQTWGQNFGGLML
jgi:hypothetical protein